MIDCLLNSSSCSGENICDYIVLPSGSRIQLYPEMNSNYKEDEEFPGIEFVKVEPNDFDDDVVHDMEIEDPKDIKRIFKSSPKLLYVSADAKSDMYEEPETPQGAHKEIMSPIQQDTVEYLEEALLLPDTAPTIDHRIAKNNVNIEDCETSCNEEILRIVRSMSKVLNKMANIGMPVDYGRYVNQHLKLYDDEIRQKTVKSILELIMAADEEMSKKYPDRSPEMPPELGMLRTQLQSSLITATGINRLYRKVQFRPETAMDLNQHGTVTAPKNLNLKKRSSRKPMFSRNTTSDTDRERIVKAYLNGSSGKLISEMLNIKLFTVYNILKKYRDTGKVHADSRGGNHKKLLSKEAGNSIRNWLEEDSTLSLKQLAIKVWETYHLRVSTTTVAREVKALRKTLQRRKLIQEAKKWKDFAPTTEMDESQSSDNFVAVNGDDARLIKEECPSLGDVSEQRSDDFDLGDTTNTDDWEETVESYKAEVMPAEENNTNDLEKPELEKSTENHLQSDEVSATIKKEPLDEDNGHIKEPRLDTSQQNWDCSSNDPLKLESETGDADETSQDPFFMVEALDIKAEDEEMEDNGDGGVNSAVRSNEEATVAGPSQQAPRAKLKTTSDEDRQRIVSAYLSGTVPKVISRMFYVNLSTVYNILKNYKKTAHVEAKKRGGNNPKLLSVDAIASIQKWIEDDCTISLKKLADKLYCQYQIRASVSTIAREIKGFNYTIKRLQQIPECRNTEKIVVERKEYAKNLYNLLDQFSDNSMVFVGEVRFHVSMRTSSRRSAPDAAALTVVPNIRSRIIIIICAMNMQGILHYSVHHQAINRESFKDFVLQLKCELRSNHLHRSVIIMDDTVFDKCAEIIEAMDDEQDHVVHLPQFSPFLNPIENLFGKWVNMVKLMNPQNEKDLIEGIVKGPTTVTAEDCEEYIRNMWSYASRCLRREEIHD
uniref:Paired domain-containing protein n=1 Tax=Anopheles culicifacies TaxID=139723 RepID=A0A182MSG7_9DIPT